MTLLTAQSPIEIEAKADEVGFSAEQQDSALSLFHSLTDRVGQAVVTLEISNEDWPRHRFFFATEPAELERLLAALRGRIDILDVTDTLPMVTDEDASAGSIAGLFAVESEGSYIGVLVAHQDHSHYTDA